MADLMVRETEEVETWTCPRCHETYKEGEYEQREVRDRRNNILFVCEDCYDNKFTLCEDCKYCYPNDNVDCLEISAFPCSGLNSRRVEHKLVCYFCMDEYSTCENCSRRVHDDDVVRESIHTLCKPCYEEDYGRCDECEEIYHRDDLYSQHGNYYCEDCCPSDNYSECAVPHPNFTINLADGTELAQETIHTFHMPGGMLDHTGQQAVTRYLLSENISYCGFSIPQKDGSRLSTNLWGDIDPVLMKKEGRLVKRIEKWCKQYHDVKLTAKQLSGIGEIIAAHADKPQMVHIKFTRELNNNEHYFVNSGSCWWAGYCRSRCNFKHYGGIGVLLCDEDGSHTCRAWLMPFTADDNPTHNVNSGRYVMFNAYGPVEYAKFARILAHLLGLSYQKIIFRADSAMYINADGYLLASYADMEGVDGNYRIDFLEDDGCGCDADYD